MQFLELDCDPWREQCFVEKEHPTARMPRDDADAASLYPAHRWVYDKRRLAALQGIECGTPEEMPARYPVFCKPITTLKGMGAGSCVLTSERDQRDNCRAGDFWMRLLTGEHVSTDMAVVDGAVRWCRNTLGVQSGSGTFDYWVVEEGSRPRLERICREWIRVQLPGYTGMVNIETIGGSLISVHLRCADQWPDLYGRKWLDALMGLYNRGTWELPDNDRAAGYSVVLFGPHGVRYAYPDPTRHGGPARHGRHQQHSADVLRGPSGGRACDAAGRVSSRGRQQFQSWRGAWHPHRTGGAIRRPGSGQC